MNLDERIEAALRRRPSDERDYDEPLRAVAPQPRRRAAPALLAVCLAVVLVGATGLVVGLAGRQLGFIGQGPSSPGGLIGCSGRAPAFAPSLLEGEGTAETGDSPAAKALRLLLADPSAQDLPRTGWHVVISTPDEVMFVGVDVSIVEVEVRRGTQGQWSVDGWSVAGYGGCPLLALPPSGYEPAAWELDPAATLTAESTQVSILVLGQGCRSGVAASPDEVRADVTYADGAVTVTASVVQAMGFQTCQSVPPTQYLVKLNGPLGDRALFDGEPWPAVQRAVAGRAMVTPSPSPIPAMPYMVKAGDTEASIAAAFHYQAEELELTNPGVDMAKLTPGQTIGLPLGHEPIDCGADQNTEPAGFFKVASMSTTFDVYCPALPAGWSVASSNEGQLNGSPADRLEIAYKGPNGETLTLVQGKFAEAAGESVKRAGPTLGSTALADRKATLLGSDGSFDIYTAPDGGAMWELAGTGMTQDQFVSIAGSMILVGK